MRISKYGYFCGKPIVLDSLQFSRSVVSESSWPHGLRHAKPPCPSPTPVYSDSCPLSQWCHPTISSSAIPFSSYLQSFPVSGSFPSSQFFTSGSQSIGVSASPSNDYSGLMCFKMDWLDLLAVQGPLKTLLFFCSLCLFMWPPVISHTH